MPAVRGFVAGSAGTTNALGGASAGFEYGHKKWMMWGQGGGVRTGDYTAPIQGEIFNSRSRTANGGGGFGWYGNKTFFSIDTKYDEGSYGVPFAAEFHGGHDEEEDEHDEEEDEHDEEGEDHDEEGDDHDEHEEEIDRIALDSRRQNYRFNWGLKDLGSAIEGFVLKLHYTDWSHDEALSPSVDQAGFAVFALEELDFDDVGAAYFEPGACTARPRHPTSLRMR